MPRESKSGLITLRRWNGRRCRIATGGRRKVFVQVIGDRWPESRRYAGLVIDGPWFDAPPFEHEWASRAGVADSIYVSGHTKLQRIR